jgi:hypothetical protein
MEKSKKTPELEVESIDVSENKNKGLEEGDENIDDSP